MNETKNPPKRDHSIVAERTRSQTRTKAKKRFSKKAMNNHML